ncbi:MAG: RloB family protein, partial [Clostridium sp.]
MSPLRELKSLTDRYSMDIEEIDELKKYYFVFEGISTEVKYFQGIQNYSKELKISNMIEIILLQKYGDIESHSNPLNLLEEAKSMKEKLINEEKFKAHVDEFVIVFDRDSYKPVDKKRKQYLQYLNDATEVATLGITNPCFELWLLLHYENYRQNLKISKTHTFASKRFSEIAGRNPKSNIRFDELLEKVDIAINQEKNNLLKQDIYEMSDNIGSNIGELIEKLR